MSFSELVDRLPTEGYAKGRMFERLCRWYLQNAPEYRLRVRRVWLWDEWPGRWGPDCGIDLVAETVDDELWAVQAKAYDPAHTVTKTDVDSFLSESGRTQFSFRLIMATTDGIGANAYRALVSQEKPVGLLMRSHLDVADVEWPVDLDSLHAPRRPAATPRPHQEAAIRDVVEGFGKAGRGQLIMACGTGKTLISMWISEALRSERTLVLVPSLTLMSQTIQEWTANASDPFDFLAVCSDETVTDRDAMVSHTADLGLPVTTDPAAVAEFAGRPGRRVVFATYQSSPRLADAHGLGAPAFDLVVADEAHRCAGPISGDFATILAEDRIRARKRLFMTATPRYFTDRIKKIAGEADFEVASMDEEQKFGPVLHRLTFGEAIRRDLLSDYIVLVVGVDEGTYRGYVERGELVTPDGRVITDARLLASHIGLAKAMRDYDLRRVVSFHGRVKRADEFSSLFPEVVKWMPPDQGPSGTIWSDYASGEMSSGKRDALLSRLRNLDEGLRGLLSNARCLAEGVDVPALDGVAFIDPRSSQIDIIQAVGRAIRKSPEKKVGVIVLPVFIAESDDPEEVLESSSFNNVWEVLKALRAHDEVLADELDTLRRRLGEAKTADWKRPGKIVLDVPQWIGVDFARAFDVRVVERTTTSWDGMVSLLRRYKGELGNCDVPRDSGEPWADLAAWVNSVRASRRNGHLPQYRIEQLDAIGFGWRVEGETLDDTTGLLNENQFMKFSGLSRIERYRKKGLIQPVGYAMAGPGVGPFYRPEQVEELKKKLGITLDDTTGLISEEQFMKRSGLSRIAQYRKKGLIKPVGYAMAGGGTGVSAFYRPEQAGELKKKLGITLGDTTGLLNEYQFRKFSGLSRIAQYRKKGLIQPVGYALAGPAVGPFYRPEQAGELKKKLGITLGDTTGLLNEYQFRKFSGLSRTAKYRKKGLIEPVGYAMAGSDVGPFYRPEQAEELKKKLGITLDDTTGLVNETQFSKKSGLSRIAQYRKKGLIQPVGYGLTRAGVSAYYRPEQAGELKKKLGITLDEITGLLNEEQFKKFSGLSRIAQYRKKDLIKPVGYAIAGHSVSPHYRPEQAGELKKKLGITLGDTTGLLNEYQFRKFSGLSRTAKYRKKGLIEPVGYAMAGSDVGPFYRPEQAEELKKELGITLGDTTGLLNEYQFRKKSGLSQIAQYRKKGLIKPVGYALARPAVGPFYRPEQVGELKKKLGITLDDITGLLNEEQFKKFSGLSRIAQYRKKGLIKPVGYAIAGHSVSPHYRPEQAGELKKKLENRGQRRV